ncbi:MAG: hypothetical protein ACHQ0J_09860 [Candidatus Dormibacterales bacterium]
MPKKQCAQRLEALGQERTELRYRRGELQQQVSHDAALELDPVDLVAVLGQIREAIADCIPQQQLNRALGLTRPRDTSAC